MDLTASSITLATVALLVASVALLGWRRRRREARDRATRDAATLAEQHLPASLHPVIDPDICIGSLSCVEACPEGDILGIVNGTGTLVRGSNCIGHGRCALECPVDAIKLVFGSSERGVDLPEIDTHFESSRPGLHIVGELGGMGLIKNAIRQGLQVAEHLGATCKAAPVRSGVDVAIIGAGAAGLATAVGCRAAGLSFRVLEQDTLGGTIASFPRHKVVMTEPVKLPLYGKFGKPTLSKEELLSSWRKVCTKAGIMVEERVRVDGIEGADGAFRLRTTVGQVEARKVVLAIGRRGTPRKLDVPGEVLPKVTYRLTDAEQYAGRRVLVVGGGDAAMEAAIALAERGDVEVTLSYRGTGLGKGRQANRERASALLQQGKIRPLFSSVVRAIEPTEVLLTVAGAERRLRNDYVIVCAGGQLPLEFLNAAGISLQRHFGTEAMPSPALGRSAAQTAGPRWLVPLLAFIGVSIVAVLVAMGKDYYVLARAERLRSPQHELLRSSGPWGHGVGIVATLFMMLNFLYPLRKRWGRLKGAAPIRSWLTVHMFIGLMSPTVIAFHAAFQSKNLLATGTFLSLIIVVATGLVGRFIYGLVPSAEGKAVELATLRSEFTRGRREIDPLLERLRDPGPARRLLERVAADRTEGGSLLGWLLWKPFHALGLRRRVHQLRPLFDDPAQYRSLRARLLELDRAQAQIRFYDSLRRLLSGWRAFHVVLSIFLVLLISAHIAVSIYLGYRWIAM